jgi:hypothetical protein
VFGYDEGGKMRGKPLAHGVIVVIGLEVGEVDAGVTWHARVHVCHEHRDVRCGIAGSKRAAKEITLCFAGGRRLEVQAEQVERCSGELKHDLQRPASKMYPMIDAASLMKEMTMHKKSDTTCTGGRARGAEGKPPGKLLKGLRHRLCRAVNFLKCNHIGFVHDLAKVLQFLLVLQRIGVLR